MWNLCQTEALPSKGDLTVTDSTSNEVIRLDLDDIFSSEYIIEEANWQPITQPKPSPRPSQVTKPRPIPRMPGLEVQAVKQPAADTCALGSPFSRGNMGPQLTPYCGRTTDSLDLVVAPGDLLVIAQPPKSPRRISTDTGSGRLFLILALPRCVKQHSQEAERCSKVWPVTSSGRMAMEVWRVCVLESTHHNSPEFACRCRELEVVMFVERGALTLVAELPRSGDAVEMPHVVVGLWQSPVELRLRLQVDLMMDTLADMQIHEANPPPVAAVSPRSARAMPLSTIQESWKQVPCSCAFPVICFWQRYLCKVADAINSSDNSPVNIRDYIIKWMPIRADQASLEQLLDSLQLTGWVSMSQIPQLSHPVLVAPSLSKEHKKSSAKPQNLAHAQRPAVGVQMPENDRLVSI